MKYECNCSPMVILSKRKTLVHMNMLDKNKFLVSREEDSGEFTAWMTNNQTYGDPEGTEQHHANR